MMTMCITFDDGLKAHASVAGPLLKRRGWSGAFNIPTAFLDLGRERLTKEQLKDLCLEDSRDKFMTWEDARQMVADGHELYPHTHDHVDLADLYSNGNRDEIEHQIVLSQKTFEAKMGKTPAFFCLPHYSTCPFVNRRIRAHQMEVFNCGRANFGGGYKKGQITQFISVRKKAGWLHVDISVHGISKDDGGWEPFDSIEDFEGFLDEIKEAENQGLVKVVPYSAVHWSYSCVSKYLSLIKRIHNRVAILLTGIIGRRCFL